MSPARNPGLLLRKRENDWWQSDHGILIHVMHRGEPLSQIIGIIQPKKVSQALGHVAQTPDLNNGLCYCATLRH